MALADCTRGHQLWDAQTNDFERALPCDALSRIQSVAWAPHIFLQLRHVRRYSIHLR